MGPKTEPENGAPGTKHHAKNRPVEGWKYDELPLENVGGEPTLLARIVIAKVLDEKRITNILRSIPVVNNDPNWRCLTWIENALVAIAKDGQAVGRSVLDWEKIQEFARRYVGDKTAAGRYRSAVEISRPRPIWDMIEEKEIVE